jgi:hypothetical protein
MNDPKLCEELGKNGKRLVLDKYNKKKQAEEYIRFVSEIL